MVNHRNVNNYAKNSNRIVIAIFWFQIVAYPVHILYRNFGECVLKEGHNYTLICNEVMKYLQSLNDPDKFLTVMEIWVQIVSLHCSVSIQ